MTNKFIFSNNYDENCFNWCCNLGCHDSKYCKNAEKLDQDLKTTIT